MKIVPAAAQDPQTVFLEVPNLGLRMKAHKMEDAYGSHCCSPLLSVLMLLVVVVVCGAGGRAQYPHSNLTVTSQYPHSILTVSSQYSHEETRARTVSVLFRIKPIQPLLFPWPNPGSSVFARVSS